MPSRVVSILPCFIIYQCLALFITLCCRFPKGWNCHQDRYIVPQVSCRYIALTGIPHSCYQGRNRYQDWYACTISRLCIEPEMLSIVAQKVATGVKTGSYTATLIHIGVLIKHISHSRSEDCNWRQDWYIFSSHFLFPEVLR